MAAKHRVDRMEELERALLTTEVPKTEVEFVAQTMMVQEAAALALIDIANSLRVYLYGTRPPVEPVE